MLKLLKIYCCFYISDTECTYEEECIFLHEDSAECKFGNDCERNNCMFKHTVPKTTKKNDGSKCEDENVE